MKAQASLHICTIFWAKPSSTSQLDVSEQGRPDCTDRQARLSFHCSHM